MKQFTILSKNKLLIALDIDDATHSEEKKQLLQNDFEVRVRNIQAENSRLAIKKAKQEHQRERSHDGFMIDLHLFVYIMTSLFRS